jgi:hypothetical protein
VQWHGLDRLIADLDPIHVGIPNYPIMSASTGGHLRSCGTDFADPSRNRGTRPRADDGNVVRTVPVTLRLLRDIE